MCIHINKLALMWLTLHICAGRWVSETSICSVVTIQETQNLCYTLQEYLCLYSNLPMALGNRYNYLYFTDNESFSGTYLSSNK